jgi:hypothetical protein
MNGNDEDRFVDELLDASLRKQRSEEPRPGLEARILAGARASERAAQRRGTWAWVLGAAAAGLAVVAVVLSLSRPRPALVPAPAPLAATKAVAPLASLVGERSALPRAGGARPYRTARATLAARRPEQFPTPRPLSEQERLLLLYVKTADQSGLAAQANQSGKDQDLEIPKLSIAALDIKPLPGSINEQER